MNILIEDTLILTMAEGRDAPFEGAIGMRGNRIELVSAACDGEAHVRRVEGFVAACGGELRRVAGRGMAAMPGLVNIHGHAPMTLMRGYADDLPLMEWLEKHIWPFEARMTPDDIARGAQIAADEMLRGGTTTCVDMYWNQEVVGEVLGRSGMRAVLGPTFATKWEQFVRDLELVQERFLAPKAFGGRVTAMLAPHAPYTCSEEQLRAVVAMSERLDMRINIHVAETLDEIRIIRRRHGCTPVTYLERIGLLERPTLAVHCVHLTDADIDILARRRVAVAHNPQSNMKLASGTAPVTKMLEKGLVVGLGTDGAASNNDLDMWEEMRSASFQQKLVTRDPTALPALGMLRMATIEGARAIGMEASIGSIEEGKLADVILIDLRRPHLQPLHNAVSNLAYCGKASDVCMTIVDGEILYG